MGKKRQYERVGIDPKVEAMDDWHEKQRRMISDEQVRTEKISSGTADQNEGTPLPYSVPADTDLFSLAKQFSVSPAELWKMNSWYFGVQGVYTIKAGTTLNLPADAKQKPQSVNAPVPFPDYSGETGNKKVELNAVKGNESGSQKEIKTQKVLGPVHQLMNSIKVKAAGSKVVPQQQPQNKEPVQSPDPVPVPVPSGDQQNETQRGTEDGQSFYDMATAAENKTAPQDGAVLPEAHAPAAVTWAYIALPPAEERGDIAWNTPVTTSIREKYHWEEVMARFRETSPVGKKGLSQASLDQWVMKNLAAGWTSDQPAPSIFQTIILPETKDGYAIVEAYSFDDAYIEAGATLALIPNVGQGFYWKRKNSGHLEFSGYGFSVHSHEGMENYKLNKGKVIDYDKLALYSGDAVHAENVKKLKTQKAQLYSDDFYELVCSLQRVFVLEPGSAIKVTGIFDAATSAELGKRAGGVLPKDESPLEYNQKNCTYSVELVNKLHQVYGDKELYDKVIAAGKIDANFVSLVEGAQSVIHLDSKPLANGKLTPGDLSLIDVWLQQDALRQDVDRITAHFLAAKYAPPEPQQSVSSSAPYTYNWQPAPLDEVQASAVPRAVGTGSHGESIGGGVTYTTTYDEVERKKDTASLNDLIGKYSNTIKAQGRFYTESAQTVTAPGSGAYSGSYEAPADMVIRYNIPAKTITTKGGQRDRYDDLTAAVNHRIAMMNQNATSSAISALVKKQESTPEMQVRALDVQQMGLLFRAISLLPEDNELRKLYGRWQYFASMVIDAERSNIPPPADYREQFGALLDDLHRTSWYKPVAYDMHDTSMIPAPPPSPKVSLTPGTRELIVTTGYNIREAIYTEVQNRRSEPAFTALADEWKANRELSETIRTNILGYNAVNAPEHKYTGKLQCWFMTNDAALEQKKHTDPRFGPLTSVQGVPLNIYYAKEEATYYGKIVLNPSAADERTFDGDSLYGMLVEMREYNVFPTGTLYFIDETGAERNLPTYGGELLSTQLGEVSLGLFFLSLLAAPFTAGLSLALTYASAATMAASAGAHIYEMADTETTSGGQLALDIAIIASALLPGVAQLKQVSREAMEVQQGLKIGSTMSHGEQFFRATVQTISYGTVAASTVYFTQNFITQYKALDSIADPRLREEMRYQLIMNALLMAFLTYHAVKGGGKNEPPKEETNNPGAPKENRQSKPQEQPKKNEPKSTEQQKGSSPAENVQPNSRPHHSPENLTSITKSFRDAGFTVVEEGTVTKFLSPGGEEVAIISEGRFTGRKWMAEKGRVDGKEVQREIIFETPEGYKLVKEGNNFGVELGFKEGRELTAEEVNGYLSATRGAKDPYMPGTKVTDRTLTSGKVYVVENADQLFPGEYGSNQKITTQAELRENVAVLESWKNDAKSSLVVREYDVISPLRVRDGIIGPQLETTPGANQGKTYPGGNQQYQFMEGRFSDQNKSSKYLKPVSETELK